jgi:hypothetical protein
MFDLQTAHQAVGSGNRVAQIGRKITDELIGELKKATK